MVRFLKRVAVWLFLIFVVLLSGLLLFRSKYSDTLRQLAETQVKNSSSDLTNDSLTELLQGNDVQYDRIVYFEKDLNGEITAMKTNIMEVNRLKTRILELVNGRILALDTTDLGIPIGNLLFPEVFSGKGFAIPIHILSIRNSDASFRSEFQQAGINQTLHRLLMDVSVDVSILVLGQTESFSVNSEVVVAETVIVGDVPDTFFNSGGIYGTQRENSGTDKAS